ncbi:type I methionyl aminopeptidase [bacterium]|nr:type I methionyl aminopeptidase [bacterium]
MRDKIIIKTPEEIEIMKGSGDILCACLDMLGENCRAGVTTLELDSLAEQFIRDHDGVPTFKGYNGYPGSVCVSINEEVVHGIPCKRRIREGDIVSIDCGVTWNGFVSDSARTFVVGEVPPEVQKLVDVTKESLYLGIGQAQVGNCIRDIGQAVQQYCESHGFSVVRDLVGHGVGRSMHEAPAVPNYYTSGKGPRLRAGMVIAIEPMINLGEYYVKQLADGWTCVTLDGRPSAHFEHTVAITENGPYILTNGIH